MERIDCFRAITPFRHIAGLSLVRVKVLLTCLTVIAGPATISPARAQLLTRAEAVAALFAPGSGVAIDTNETAVWSPYADFGFGPGREGLLPSGTRVDPQELGWLPFPGPGMTNVEPAYFFWLDDLPAAHFQHPTRFILVRADIPAPTVAGGGIRTSEQGWWPRLIVLLSAPREYFSTSDERASSTAPGASNPDGLIAGPAYDSSAPPAVPSSEPGLPLLVPPAVANNACGLIARGSNGKDFESDVTRFEEDLRNHHGVPSGRIIKANGGAAATSNDVFRAITNLCGLQPPCDKIYIRTTSHGSIGGYNLADGSISSANLCSLFRMLSAKGVPICLLMNGCHTGSLVDAHHWNFAAGSVIIFAANTNQSSWGHSTKFTNDVVGCVTNSLFVDAFSRCLNDPMLNRGGRRATDAEAYVWVLSNRLCYTWTANNMMYYPANPPAGGTSNPDPQTHSVGANGTNININVCNATGSPKTNFHLIFKGDVRSGYGRAWESDANDRRGGTWDSEPTVTYDSERDETMVCWKNGGSPVPAGGYIHFGFFRSGGGLRPARQGWGAAVLSGPPANRVASAENTFRRVPGGAPLGIVRLAVRGIENGGWGQPMQAAVAARFLPHAVTLEDLNLGNPEIADQPPIFLGSGFVSPDTAQEFEVSLPPIPPGHTAWLILETRLLWEVSNNQSIALELFPITIPIEPAEVLITRLSNRRVGISWTGNGILQAAPSADGPWQDLPSTGQPVVLPANGPGRFFRGETPVPGN